MKRIVIAAALISVLGSATAFAQPYYPQNKPPQHNTQGRPGPSHMQPDHKPGYRPAPPPQRWSRGKPLPREYRHQVIRDRDYGRYRLPPPRRGYQWVRVDNNYLMIGIATGIIASVVQGY